jgi:protein kinase C substrate 80K-H
MAVLEAVRGWEYFAGISDDDDDDAVETASAPEDVLEEDVLEGDVLEEGMWTAERLDQDLDSLLDSDYVSLLLEHEAHIRSPPSDTPCESLLCISSRAASIDARQCLTSLPMSLILSCPTIKAFEQRSYHGCNSWELCKEWLTVRKVRIRNCSSSLIIVNYIITEAVKARQAFESAEHSLKLAREEKSNTEENIRNIFRVDRFGAEGEWKKLEETCLELDTGECVFSSWPLSAC